MPSTSIRIRLRVRCACKDIVHTAAILDCGGSVYSGTDKWMRELNATSHLKQTGVDSSIGRGDLDIEQFRCTTE